MKSMSLVISNQNDYGHTVYQKVSSQKLKNKFKKCWLYGNHKSDMASPIVCVLKGENGKDVVPIAIDYRCLTNFVWLMPTQHLTLVI